MAAKEGEAPPYGDPAIQPLDHFDGARDAPGPADRLREVRRRARGFRERLEGGPRVRFLRSFGLVRVPYPAKYGLRDALAVPTPLIHILNRLFVVQVDAPDGVRTVLVSPSDTEANAETPFFRRLGGGLAGFGSPGQKLIAPVLMGVQDCLREVGLHPEDVDYITYDHLHTQDVRRWLGTGGDRGYFPNAKLLVTRQEWESTHALLPSQRDWYCPRGTDGIDPERVVLLDDDVMVGDGLALIRTPGHTEGNHSIVTHTAEGVFVTSENGVAPECYNPLSSRIPGVRKFAAATGMEVILNGNTLEGAVDQYISMVQEKEMAGPSLRNPDFPNMLCSSELTSYWAFPGVKPTFSFGDVSFGAPVLDAKGRRRAEAA